MNPLIYGKDSTERIVSIEPQGKTALVYREHADGTVTTEEVANSYFILFSDQLSDKMRRLNGNQHYRWIIEYQDEAKYREVLSSSYKKKYDLWTVRDPKESLMVKDGLTYFKGMKVEDVSILSFDIETTGLVHDETSKVLLISNTFRRNGQITRKLFSVDEFADSAADMISAWADWVREMNPSVLVGHNLYGFDLPYLEFVSNGGLKLGRDGSRVQFANRTSQFRKDGSQSYDYDNVLIHGREIVDTWFLSMKYDVAARREYESYGLKYIVQFELDALKTKKKEEKKKFTTQDQQFLERLSHGGNRVLYDASRIRDNWSSTPERAKIKAYAIDDADDALTLYDLMIPSFFYYTQSIPRSFQSVINSATGSQINSLMVRSYLQDGHSIAKGSDKEEFEGAISFGVPGIHKNVFKIDVQSLYPSIILSEKICNRAKDPKENFLKIIRYFTEERIRNKEKFEATGDTYFGNLSDAQKIVINSMYGFLGAPKLSYNSPADASRVTQVGREILTLAIHWATGKAAIPNSLEHAEDSDNDAA